MCNTLKTNTGVEDKFRCDLVGELYTRSAAPWQQGRAKFWTAVKVGRRKICKIFKVQRNL